MDAKEEAVKKALVSSLVSKCQLEEKEVVLFLATLVALHLTPVSKSVGESSFRTRKRSLELASLLYLIFLEEKEFLFVVYLYFCLFIFLHFFVLLHFCTFVSSLIGKCQLKEKRGFECFKTNFS